jgi:hypothetical protein
LRRGVPSALQLKQYEEIRRIMRLGYKYAHRLHLSGSFNRFDTSKVKLERIRRPSSLAVSPAASMDGSEQLLSGLGGGALPQRA